MKEKMRNVLRNLPYPDAKYAASFAFSAARLLGGKYRGGGMGAICPRPGHA